MTDGWRKIETAVHYRGLEVTLIGDTTAGLLAIAGYGTYDELAIGAIAVRHCDGRPVYSLAGADEQMTSVEAVAEAAVRVREARDARAD